MVKKAYLPLYVRDFLSDPIVLGMTFTEQAVYLRMLMLSWEVGPLRGDTDRLARMVGLARDVVHDSERRAVENVLGLCWSQSGDGWTNPRLERERQRSDVILEGQRARAAKARETLAAARASNVRPDASPSVSQQSQAQAQVQEKSTTGTPSVSENVQATETDSLRESVAAQAPQRSLSEKQAAAVARKSLWASVWREVFHADCRVSKAGSNALRLVEQRLKGDHVAMTRLIREFLRAPPFKCRQNPTPEAFHEHLDALQAGLLKPKNHDTADRLLNGQMAMESL